MQRWARAGADLILGGHIHLPYVLPLPNILGGLPRRVWTVQAGTALSWRTRGTIDNSVNLIRHERGAGGAQQASVERWDYSETSGAFEMVARHELALDGAPPPRAVTQPG